MGYALLYTKSKKAKVTPESPFPILPSFPLPFSKYYGGMLVLSAPRYAGGILVVVVILSR